MKYASRLWGVVKLVLYMEITSLLGSETILRTPSFYRKGNFYFYTPATKRSILHIEIRKILLFNFSSNVFQLLNKSAGKICLLLPP